MLFMLIFFTRRARKLKSEILCDFEKDWIAVPGKWFLFKKEVLNKDFLEKKPGQNSRFCLNFKFWDDLSSWKILGFRGSVIDFPE